jgi:hypothetical protein
MPPSRTASFSDSELIDSLGEALCQLAATIEPERAGAEVQGADQGDPAQALEDGRAEVLDRLQPVGRAEIFGMLYHSRRQEDDQRQQGTEKDERADNAGEHIPSHSVRPAAPEPHQARHLSQLDDRVNGQREPLCRSISRSLSTDCHVWGRVCLL